MEVMYKVGIIDYSFGVEFGGGRHSEGEGRVRRGR
jgi:hypothetical protein